MLNRFNGAVEEVGGDLPRGETPRLGDAIDQVRYALAVMNNVARFTAEQQYRRTAKIYERISKAPRKQRTRLVVVSR